MDALRVHGRHRPSIAKTRNWQCRMLGGLADGGLGTGVDRGTGVGGREPGWVDGNRGGWAGWQGSMYRVKTGRCARPATLIVT